MRFYNYINELFTKPLKFHVAKRSTEKTVYEFIIKSEDEEKEKEYEVFFWKEDYEPWTNNTYEIIFQLTRVGSDVIASFEREGITGTGDAVKVFSTLAAILKDFVSYNKPDLLYFSASKPSRIKLYKAFQKQIKAKSYLKQAIDVKSGAKTVFINARVPPERLQDIEEWLGEYHR